MSHSTNSSPSFLTSLDVKLDGTNYKMWLTTIHVILLGMELLRHVDDTSTPPSESTSSATSSGSSPIAPSRPSRSTWQTDDHRVMTFISQSYEIIIKMEIGHLETAREMLDHLRHMFKQSSEAREYAVV